RMMWFGGSFRPADGQPIAPIETMTLAGYPDQQGGTPLWLETQTVVMASDGPYNVVLGSTTPEGLPLELFTAREPRWLGVRFHRTGESEQPRVQLVSVPYALKASDADTLGGRPASAYALAEPLAAASVAAAGGGTAATTRTGSTNPTASTTNTAGSAGHIGV